MAFHVNRNSLRTAGLLIVAILTDGADDHMTASAILIITDWKYSPQEPTNNVMAALLLVELRTPLLSGNNSTLVLKL